MVHVLKEVTLVNSCVRFVLPKLIWISKTDFYPFLCFIFDFLLCHWPRGHSWLCLFLFTDPLVCFRWFFSSFRYKRNCTSKKHQNMRTITLRLSAGAVWSWSYEYLSLSFSLVWSIHWVVYLLTKFKNLPIAFFNYALTCITTISHTRSRQPSLWFLCFYLNPHLPGSLPHSSLSGPFKRETDRVTPLLKTRKGSLSNSKYQSP